MRITAGQHKDSVGILVSKQKRGAEVELGGGLKVIVPYPQVVIEAEEGADKGVGLEENRTAKEPEVGVDGTLTVEFTLDEMKAGPKGNPDETKATQDVESQTDTVAEMDIELKDRKSVAVETSDLSELTVKQLQVLAKSRGIGIARTKADFIRIITEKNPEVDPDCPRNGTFGQGYYAIRSLMFDGVSENPAIPVKYALKDNYPNPFNTSTTICYDLPLASKVRLTVYNITGQRVAVLCDGIESSGFKQYDWNVGNSIASGIYLLRMEAVSLVGGKRFTDTSKIMLIK